MRVFERYSFNLNKIKFKENKEYFDKLFQEFGLDYNGISFCLRCINGEKTEKSFPFLKEYKTYYESNTELSECIFATINDDSIYLKEEYSEQFDLLISKIPRPLNFNFAGVVLDKVCWNDEDQPPCFDSLDNKNHRYRGYYSNSVRFFREFDYGNKLNIIELMVERKADLKHIQPLPQRFMQVCQHLGKPIHRELICLFSKEEKAEMKKADSELNTFFDNANLSLFSNFIESNTENLMCPVPKIPIKEILKACGKEKKFKYKGCESGIYMFECLNENNHKIKVEFSGFGNFPMLEATIWICGYNFEHCALKIPRIYVNSEDAAKEYAKAVFDFIGNMKNDLNSMLLDSYGKTPHWYFA